MGYLQFVSFAFTCLDDALLVPDQKLSKTGMRWMQGNAVCAEILLSTQDTGPLSGVTAAPITCHTTGLPMPTKCNDNVLLPSVTQVKAQSDSTAPVPFF